MGVIKGGITGALMTKIFPEIEKCMNECKKTENVTMNLTGEEALLIEGYRVMDEEDKCQALLASAAMLYAKKLEDEDNGSD